MPKRPQSKARRANGHGTGLTRLMAGGGRSARRAPATKIAALKALPLDRRAFLALVDALEAIDAVQAEKLNPTGGASLRFRIEMAAVLTWNAVTAARQCAAETGGEASMLERVTLDLVIDRAMELDRLHAGRR